MGCHYSSCRSGISFYLTKYYERKMEWQREKINHYKTFLSALSDLANNKGDKKVREKMAHASNDLAIIAPKLSFLYGWN